MITLEAEDLSINRNDKEIVKGVSFSVKKGEIFALLGGNGAGKTTTLLSFLGLLTPSNGAVRVNGVEVLFDVTEARRSIAYLPEAANLYPHLSAIENIQYFLSLATVKRNIEEINATLDKVNLAVAARSNHLALYSKGMRQKVSIALAILREAPILLLDEPTSGLDPIAIDEFNRLTAQLAKDGTTVLMVTHDVYGACQIANRIGLLRHGALVGVFEAQEGGQISPEEVHKAFVEGA